MPENITTEDPKLGDAHEGGYLIYQSDGMRWIVSPANTEMYLAWDSREEAVSLAESVTGYTGWFIPTREQLRDISYVNREYWDSYRERAAYWSDTVSDVEGDTDGRWMVTFHNGNDHLLSKDNTRYVRVIRCVSY